jgi:hypothetical protein
VTYCSIHFCGLQVTTLKPLEREAERASDTFGRGRTDVRERLAGRLPLCHPVYISSHGSQGYLDAAAKFYARWGYSPVHRGVPSIEAIVRDLAGQSSIGQVTIVSHAYPALMQIQFVDGGPDQVEKSDWQVDTSAELGTLERHFVPPAMIDQVIGKVQSAAPGALPPIGPVSDPVVRQFIWWVVDEVYAEYQGFPAAQAIRLKTAVQAHTAVYRSRLLSPPTQPAGTGSGQPAVTAIDLAVAEQAVRTQALRWQWPKLGSGPTQPLPQGAERRVSESPSAAILRIMQTPDFLSNLTLVRNKISDASWIEVQGCNAGADRSYLEAIQSFFGGTAKKPKVTGPDWFQAFAPDGYGYYALPDTKEAAKAWWEAKDISVPAALRYWYPIITGRSLPRTPTHLTLLAYLRQGHALPLAVPSALGKNQVLFLGKHGLKAFLEWLSLHSYRLTKVAEIKTALFPPGELGQAIKGVPVDMLEERFQGPTKIIFRPSPEYNRHIIKVP